MKLLLREDITYTTKLEKDEIISRLLELVETRRRTFKEQILGIDSTKPYQGYISGNSFSICKTNASRSLNAHITGTIEYGSEETKVNVKIRMANGAEFFVYVIAIGVGWTCLFCVYAVFSGKANPQLGMLAPFAMLAFLYFLVSVTFGYELDVAKAYVQELFEALPQNL